MTDPYSILGISPDATEEQIKDAYKELAKKYHPDQYENNPLEDLALEKMKEINTAYDEAIRRARSSSGNRGYNNYAGNNEYADYGQIRDDITRGKIDQADAALDNILENARGAEWHFCKGSVQYKRGWYSEAYRCFETAHQMEPDNGEYAAAYENIKKQPMGYNPYAGKYDSGPYTARRAPGSECNMCDICTCLMCLDCCCR